MANILYGSDFFAFTPSGASFKNIANAESYSLSLKMGDRDTTTKDSGPYKESQPAEMEWSVSVDGLVSNDANVYNTAYLLNLWKARTIVPVKMGAAQASGTYGNYLPAATGLMSSGNTWLTDLKIDGKQGENVTYSATFKGTGEIYFY